MQRLLALFCCLAYSYWPAAAQAQQLELYGTVRQHDTQEALPGVQVRVQGQPEAVAVSDTGGHYRLVLPMPAGGMVLYCQPIGYDSVAHNWQPGMGSPARIDFSLSLQVAETDYVDIQARRIPTHQPLATLSTISLRQENLDQQAGADLRTALENAPGVMVLNNQINIRGASGYNIGGGSRVLVLLDGLPVMNPDRWTVNYFLLPTDNIERVDIVKGSSSLRYGNGALGGVVNVITRTPETKPQAGFRVQGRLYGPAGNDSVAFAGWGSFYQTSFHAYYAQRWGKYGLSVMADGVRNGGYRAGEYTNRFRLYVRNQIQAKPNLQIGLDAHYLWENAATFVFWAGWPDSALYPGYNSLAYTTAHTFTFDPRLRYVHPKGHEINVDSRFYLQRLVNSKITSGTNLQVYSNFHYHKQFRQWLELDAGAQYAYNRATPDTGKALSQNHQFSAFGLVTFKLWKPKKDTLGHRLRLEAGLRYQFEQVWGDTNLFVAAFNPVNLLSMNDPLVSLGANLRLHKATYIRAAFSQGARSPSIVERFANVGIGGFSTYASPYLKTEKGFTVEGGVAQYFAFSKGRTSLFGYIDIAGFGMELQNMIEFQIDRRYATLNHIAFASQNIANVSIAGVEVAGQFSLRHGRWMANVSGGLTWIRPIDRNGLTDIDGDEGAVRVFTPPVQPTDPNYQKYLYDVSRTLKYRSEWTIRLSGSVGWNGLMLTANYRHISYMQNVDKLLLLAITGVGAFRASHRRGMHVLDLILAYTVKKRHTLSFHVFNAANEVYMILPGQLGEPRSFGLQYALRW